MDQSRFRFNIGESVKYVGTPGKYEHQSVRYMIVGRRAEECMGGVQYFYHARHYRPGIAGEKEISVLAEFEVEALSDEDADPVAERVDKMIERHKSA